MAMVATAAKSPTPSAAVAMALPDMVARDTIIAWYRGEFAAANAIIDALCSHIVQITGGTSDYDAVFAAIHSRRMNWIPVLHMQRYFSIADVANELHRVADNNKPPPPAPFADAQAMKEDIRRSIDEDRASGRISEGSQEQHSTAESFDHKMAGEDKSIVAETGYVGGSHEEKTWPENVQICTDHDGCAGRLEKIKICKGFVAKEPVKGHMASSSIHDPAQFLY